MIYRISFTMLCRAGDVDNLTDELNNLCACAMSDDQLSDAFVNRLDQLYNDTIRRGEYFFDDVERKIKFRYIEGYQLLFGSLTESLYQKIVQRFQNRVTNREVHAGHLLPHRYADTILYIPGYDILNQNNHFHLIIGSFMDFEA